MRTTARTISSDKLMKTRSTSSSTSARTISTHTTVRNASRPASNRNKTRSQNRPNNSSNTNIVNRAIEWSRTRNARLINVVVAIIFLIGTIMVSLALRTAIVEISFESNKAQNQIMQLQQDVSDDQAKLDSMEASLPKKAQDLGMVSQDNSVSIDLKDYKPSEGMK
ncbi:MAG: hypothetical protein Q3961_00100 [Bifidobacteriaceae bacterium]|nr:hypothetical protein [Bifidobacteriaceae bacterium]